LSEFELKKPKTYRETVAVTNRVSEVGMEFPKEIFILGKANKTKENVNPKNGPTEETMAEGDETKTGEQNEKVENGSKEEIQEVAPVKPKKVYKINNEEFKPENMST